LPTMSRGGFSAKILPINWKVRYLVINYMESVLIVV